MTNAARLLISPVFLTAILFPWSAMTIPKGLSILFIFAGLAGVIAAIRRGQWRSLFPPVPSILFGLFLTWALFKSLSVFDGQLALGLWGRLAALCLAGFGTLWLFNNIDPNQKRAVETGFLVSTVMALLAAVVVFAVFKTTGFALLGWKYHDPLLALSPGLIVLAIFSGPIIWKLWQENRRGWAIVYPIVLFLVIVPMSTNIATLALITSIVALGVGFFSPRIRVGIVGGFLVIISAATIFVSANSLRTVANNEKLALQPPFNHMEESFRRSIQHRLQIWDFTAGKAVSGSVFGWGLNSSRRLPGGNEKTFLGEAKMPLHPHNAVLQIWVELGNPGVLILAGLLIYFACACMKAKAVLQPGLFSMLITGYVVASLAFGIWQNWWLSALWLSATLVPAIVLPREDNGR